uniref:FYVE-type domain-containing protein n=1 Tax=Meloidogyne incognita TaxID=6306 RepID=A0A914LI17_MELIC
MLCSKSFSIVVRRHHCRACGRVLCSSCCSNKRSLAYDENPSNKHRVCTPCNRTLDRIEEYEKRVNENLEEEIDGPSTSNAFSSTNQFNSNNDDQNKKLEQENLINKNPKKSLLKPPRRDSIDILNNLNKNKEEKEVEINNNEDKEEEERGEVLEEEEGRNKKENLNEECSKIPTTSTSKLIEEENSTNITNKKSVKFRDGVHPGQGVETSSKRRKIIKPFGKDKDQNLKQTTTESSEEKNKNQNNPYSWLINKESKNSDSESTNSSKIQENEENCSLNNDSSSASSSTSSQNQQQNNSLPENEVVGLENKVYKRPKRISSRTKERKLLDEQTSLLHINHWRVCMVTSIAEDMSFQKMDKVIDNLLKEDEEEGNEEENNNNNNNPCIVIALRRNFYVKIQLLKNFKINQQEIEILNFTTYGMTTLGVDELMLVIEFKRDRFSVQEQLESAFFNVLEQFEQIYLDCLNSFDDLLDHRMGIRKCNNRIQRLYYLNKHMRIFMGHPTEAIYFYRPQGLDQHLNKLNCPKGPFLLGVLVREEEIAWARCAPLRLLLRLGQFSFQYPTPIVNIIRDQPLFTKDVVQSSVLKVLNDFRGWTYQMTKLFDTSIIVKNNLTEIFLPKSARDEIRTLVESNRNMVAWSLNELSFLNQQLEIDSHLICEQKNCEDGQQQQHFCTTIFMKEPNMAIKATSASFVIFDGALKCVGGEKFVVNVVEDGLIIRLQSELMEELVKILLNTTDEDNATFEAINLIQIEGEEEKQQKLIIQYIEGIEQQQINNNSDFSFGALISPIDGLHLGGQFQYGLQLQRQFNSINFFQYSTEWAIRLATVINMLPGKWPSALQPRFFDACEQLAKLVAITLEPFLPGLIALDQLFIAMRIHVDEENVSYETKHWDVMPDQHFVWTVTLDEQIIPFLYSLCAWVPSSLRVELHMPILSIRSLPSTTIDLVELNKRY